MTTPTPEEKLAAEMYSYVDNRTAFVTGLRLGKAEGDAKGYARAKTEGESLGAQLRGIAERLDGCFEPTVPLTPIVSELVPAVRDAIIQLRTLASIRSLAAAPDKE